MELIKRFKKNERVRLEYIIDSIFMKDEEIYYTLKNPDNATILKGVAFTAEELIPVEEGKEASDGELATRIRPLVDNAAR